MGSSGVVQATRCFLWAGMLRWSPGIITTVLSPNSILAAPSRTITSSLVCWSYQKPLGDMVTRRNDLVATDVVNLFEHRG
jgi:hypothetical protein